MVCYKESSITDFRTSLRINLALKLFIAYRVISVVNKISILNLKYLCTYFSGEKTLHIT